jgi:hypothetical protein
MTLENQVQVWDINKNLAGLNRLMAPQTFPSWRWDLQLQYIYMYKQTIKDINMDSTLAG